jgi:hypothetical protein
MEDSHCYTNIQKGDINNPDNYRGISLLNTGYKIYSKIIAKRLIAIADVLLLEEQNGFMKGRSCMDCIFSAPQIIKSIENLTSPHILLALILKKPLTPWTETNYVLLC